MWQYADFRTSLTKLDTKSKDKANETHTAKDGAKTCKNMSFGRCLDKAKDTGDAVCTPASYEQIAHPHGAFWGPGYPKCKEAHITG